MKSVMNHNFSKVPAPEIQRSTFDRSCGHKTAFNPGDLIPFFCDEILPGDTVKMTASLLARLSTMIFPIMDNVFIDTFFFFVPNRLVWQNWERFNGAQDSPGDSTEFMLPYLVSNTDGPTFTLGEYSLFDFFGLPTQVSIDNTSSIYIQTLPLRAYNLIWDEWFRDQNLQDRVTVNLSDTPDRVESFNILRRGKRHDYFSSCLPFPQKGDSVQLPLGDSAPIRGTGATLGLSDFSQDFGVSDASSTGLLAVSTAWADQDIGETPATFVAPGTTKIIGVNPDSGLSGMVADLGSATAATINQLRQAFAFQKILERDARGGTRYVEMLKAHFGVTSPDFRLQRPEYLGGSSQRMNVSAVQQTSETATTPQGNLAAFSSTATQCHFTKSFVEHGHIIGLVNVRADISYQGGLNRMWTRNSRFDFYLPALAHLGEQAVLNNEILYKSGAGDVGLVFGYQERWAEYRYKPSMVTGAFRSNAADTLDSWHLALDFNDTTPLLNADFIQDNPPLDRVLAVTSAVEPNIILDSYFSYKHTRPMPTYSVPGQIDRF